MEHATGMYTTSPPLSPPVRRKSAARAPGRIELLLVHVYLVLILISTPNNWFVTYGDDLQSGPPNPYYPLIQVLAFAGSSIVLLGAINSLIRAVLSERLLLAFLMWSFASSFWSDNPTETLLQSGSLFMIMAFGWYLAVRFPIGTILLLAARSAIVAILINMVWILALPRYGINPAGNFVGVFQGKNQLGQATMWCLVVVASSLSKLPRSMSYPALGLGLVLLVGSESTTAVVAGIFALCLMLLYRAFRARRSLYGAVVVSLSTASLVGTLLVTANLGPITQMLGKDITLTGRTQLWQDILPEIYERPIFGSGFRAFFLGFDSPAHELWVKNTWHPPSAHNGALAVLLELGVVGLAILLWVLARLLQRGAVYVRFDSSSQGLFPLGLLSIVVLQSVTESGVFDTPYGVLLLTATLTALSPAGLGSPNGAGSDGAVPQVRAAKQDPTSPLR